MVVVFIKGQKKNSYVLAVMLDVVWQAAVNVEHNIMIMATTEGRHTSTSAALAFAIMSVKADNAEHPKKASGSFPFFPVDNSNSKSIALQS